MKQDIFDQQPALKPPPGVTPNFVDPPNLAGPSIVLITCAFFLIILAVSSRIYTKAVVVQKMVLEDCALAPMCLHPPIEMALLTSNCPRYLDFRICNLCDRLQHACDHLDSATDCCSSMEYHSKIHDKRKICMKRNHACIVLGNQC